MNWNEILMRVRLGKFVLAALVLAICTVGVQEVSSQVNPNHVYVKGYYRSDGSYVPAHYRTAPNQTPWDNFSTVGNVNPYTGEVGKVVPSTNRVQSLQDSDWKNLERDYPRMPSCVTRSRANIRSLADASSELVGTVGKGEELRIVGYGRQWLQISFVSDGEYIVGFVHENLIRITN